MKSKDILYGTFLYLMLSCGSNQTQQQEVSTAPQVSEQGKKIVFPSSEDMNFFYIEAISNGALNAEINAPAKVAATVIPSQEESSQHIVLFEDPELGGTYSQLMQHQININHIRHIAIKQKKIELERIGDLQKHGSATGRDVLEAQAALSMEETNLANEKAAMLEHESKLKAAGFNPAALQSAPAGTAYVVCDIPENQIGRIKTGTACSIYFTSFPEERFSGTIEDIADMIDNVTRMIKLRVRLANPDRKVRAGMFANVRLDLKGSDVLSIPRNALITVQGKDYVFVKTSPSAFERREVSTGAQIQDRIVILKGVQAGDTIAVKGVIQLKGLSFGY